MSGQTYVAMTCESRHMTYVVRRKGKVLVSLPLLRAHEVMWQELFESTLNNVSRAHGWMNANLTQCSEFWVYFLYTLLINVIWEKRYRYLFYGDQKYFIVAKISAEEP